MNNICTKCRTVGQMNNTEDGELCFGCYRIYKQGKSFGQEVTTCSNCHFVLSKNVQRCIKCGNEVDSNGFVIKI